MEAEKHSTDLATYTVAVRTPVCAAPRGQPLIHLDVGAVIRGQDSVRPGWVAWIEAGECAGYLHRGDLDVETSK